MREGCLGKLGWMSGRRQPDQSLYLTPKILSLAQAMTLQILAVL